MEGEGGGMVGVVVCFWVTPLPGEKGAGCTAGEVGSVSMSTRGDPDELGALPKNCGDKHITSHTPSYSPPAKWQVYG